MELEERGDAVGARLVEPRGWPCEVLEPLEVARVRGWGLGEGLGVGSEVVGLANVLAGLREELGVLLEDLEVLLLGLDDREVREFADVFLRAGKCRDLP